MVVAMAAAARSENRVCRGETRFFFRNFGNKEKKSPDILVSHIISSDGDTGMFQATNISMEQELDTEEKKLPVHAAACPVATVVGGTEECSKGSSTNYRSMRIHHR